MTIRSAEYLVGFMPQTGTGPGQYNATLDAISGTWTAAQGLLLGDSATGVKGSGLNLTLGRRKREKPFLGASYTRSLSDFLAAEVRTFQFAVPFVGNRGDASTPPVDGDAPPLAGINAILQGMGMLGAAWGSGVGHRYVFALTDPVSALVYYSGNRLELLDCSISGSIDYSFGSIPILTAAVEVGSIKDHSEASHPTPTYGEQASVSAPAVEDVGFAWGATRGFQNSTLAITPNFERVGDANLVPPVRIRQTGREVKFTGELYYDDTATITDGYEYAQMIEQDDANLDQLSFQVGSSMTSGNPVEAVQVVMPKPELDDNTPIPLGDLAGNTVSLFGRGSDAAGNDELEFIFR